MVLMETKVSMQRAQRIISNLGYTNHFNRMAGGIWMLWNANSVSVDVVPFSTQAVHVIVSFNNMGEWLFSLKYISSVPCKKAGLWESMKNIANQINIPWDGCG